MSGVFYYFLFFFKVDSGVFLFNRVATMVALLSIVVNVVLEKNVQGVTIWWAC